MTITNHLQFETYLKSISEDENYNCWWKLYTLTDAEDKKRQKQFSSPFDFGLMVQRVESKQEQEKTERLPVLSGIRKYAKNHVLLVGKPGSGKSTALKRLLLEEANHPTPSPSPSTEKGVLALDKTGEGWSVPVLVELRYWQSSIFERIEAFLLQHDANLNFDESTLKNLLRQGRFLLLIDGVNELPSEEARRQVVAFRKDFPQTPMIFTTRDLSVGGDLGIEKKLEMQPLNENQMRDFVMGYLPEQGEELLQCLKDRLQEFGKTPLLLWMLCGLFQQTGNIPPNLGMVFRFFTQSYESNWRGDVAAQSRRWWKSLLEHLAFKMMQGKPETEFRVAIPKWEVEEIFTQYLDAEKLDKPRDNAKCWLDDLIKHHLIQVGSGNQIEFRHQLLQEYYAAECLLRLLPNLSDAQLKCDYLNLLKWTEPLAVMLALVENTTQAEQLVQSALDVDLILGARLAGEVKS
ncbi:MAG: NB-ARC domain-containing protein, partial [Cyanobacteria bacterium J06635_10]